MATKYKSKEHIPWKFQCKACTGTMLSRNSEVHNVLQTPNMSAVKYLDDSTVKFRCGPQTILVMSSMIKQQKSAADFLNTILKSTLIF